MNERKPSLKWLAVLAAILLVVLMLSAVPQVLPKPKPAPWNLPQVTALANTPTPTPGWWDAIPTPMPLVP